VRSTSRKLNLPMPDLSASAWTAGSLLTITLLAVVGGAIALERLVVLSARSGGNRRDFLESVLTLTREGQVEEAIKACADRPAVVSDVGLLILRSRSRDEHELDRVGHAASLLVTPRLNRRLALVRTVALLSVMVGLVGTLGALREAILAGAAMADAVGAMRDPAVGRSLGPLIAGLLVAIPMAAIHAALANRAEVVAQRVEEFAVRLVHSLVDRPDVRLGHR
jgi:biopolymer transport protein ExbB/TolQ